MGNLVIFISLSLFSLSAQASELKDRFIRTTQMKEGNYVLVKGDESCDEGELSINDMGSEITLILGARPLVLGIGLENVSETDRSCTTVITGTFEGRRATGERLSTCKKLGVTRYSVEVDFSDRGLTYTRRVFQNGRTKIRESHCVLKLEP